MFQLKYDDIANIIEATFVGKVQVFDIVAFIKAVTENKEYPRAIKVLIIGQNANAHFSVNDLDIFNNECSKFIAYYERARIAIVINNPKNTALSILFKQLFISPKVDIDVFSTKNTALNWVNL